jgi:hypothetical protein
MTAALMNQLGPGSHAYQCGLRAGCNRMLARVAEPEDATQRTCRCAQQHS